MSTEATPQQLGLPYAEITSVATRKIVRANVQRGGRETVFVDIDNISIREGFNLRKVYTGIADLAKFILSNGLPGPLVIDMLPDGTCFIEQGHRRYKALKKIQEKDPDQFWTLD